MFSRLILVISLLQCVFSYRDYERNIPNGAYVPHPCKPNYIWKGVGHFLDKGTGFRNPFGEDFAAEGHAWTDSLCRKDSDGDGLTNGQELGDPDCEWNKNRIPKRKTGLSHPGICDPWDSPECFKKATSHPLYTTQEEWMREMCKADEFVCDALKEPDVRNVTIRFPPTKVPAEETTYMCQIFDFTDFANGDFHMTATQPLIDNDYVMHHMVLSGCLDEVEATPGPYKCGMVAHEKCMNFLSIWTVGLAGECYHSNTGMRLGTHGYKRIALQFHWNNPQLRNNYNDSSGMILHFTEKRRTYDAGVLMTGTDSFHIAPGQEEATIENSCTGTCTKKILKGPIHITSAWNHMHYAGSKMSIELRRNGTFVTYLTNDPIYSYDSPQVHEYKDNPIMVNPGDEIFTRCGYDTHDKSKTIFFGDATSDEMCYGFITYYPKENVTDPPFCSGTSKYSHCDPQTWGKCKDLYSFGSEAFLKDQLMYKEVVEDCSPFSPCRKECIDTVTKYKKSEPCMTDHDAWEMSKFFLGFYQSGRDFLARLASCEVEVYIRMTPATPAVAMDSGSTLAMDSGSTLTVSIITQLLILFTSLTMVLIH